MTKTPRRRATFHLHSYQGQIRFFLLPFLVGSILLTVIPALATVAVAFTRYNAIQAPSWAALNNFQRLFTSPLVMLSLRHSLIFLALAVPLRLLGALALALLLQPRQRLYGLYRVGVFLPTIIPEAAYALLWLWILNPLYGPLNMLLNFVNLPAPAWLVEPGSARIAMVIVSLFQIGEGFVVLLAGLRNIPRSLYDSARVDGATRWQAFWRITVPLLLPWMMVLTFRDLIVSLQNTFTSSYVLTYGGPYYATTFVPLLVYELAFDLFDLGLAAALLVLVYCLVTMAVIGVLHLVGLQGSGRDI
jgi:multiple sugar transport system permease protein